ncbi:MAG: lipopolysaccharide transport periplasmic protein LptA [Pseudorhodobacter sp.]
MLFGFRPFIFLLCLISLSTPAFPQGAQIDFGGLRQDTSLPVEVTADQLAVDQGNGSATFSGNVLVGQGEMRLSAAEVRVEYTEDGGGIRRLHASGGVMLASPSDAAEASEAVYTIASGEVIMTGNVLLTQGQNAISGQKLVVNLKSGMGTMQGRVQTVFRPGSANP